MASAVVGGWVFGMFGGQGVTAFNLPSLLSGFVGAVIALAVVNLVLPKKWAKAARTWWVMEGDLPDEQAELFRGGVWTG